MNSTAHEDVVMLFPLSYPLSNILPKQTPHDKKPNASKFYNFETTITKKYSRAHVCLIFVLTCPVFWAQAMHTGARTAQPVKEVVLLISSDQNGLY